MTPQVAFIVTFGAILLVLLAIGCFSDRAEEKSKTRANSAWMEDERVKALEAELQPYREAWKAASDEAMAAIEILAPYTIKHSAHDGMWRVYKNEPAIHYSPAARAGFPYHRSVLSLESELAAHKAGATPEAYLTCRQLPIWGKPGTDVAFSTKRQAEAWLKAWIKPIRETVLYDETGSKLENTNG